MEQLISVFPVAPSSLATDPLPASRLKFPDPATTSDTMGHAFSRITMATVRTNAVVAKYLDIDQNMPAVVAETDFVERLFTRPRIADWFELFWLVCHMRLL